MRPFFQLAVWLAVLAAAFASPARAQDSAFYAVTYVELMPDDIASGTTLMKQYRDVTRREPGNLRFDVLHEIARPSRFAIIETWNDKAARDAHDQAAATAQFRDRLKSIEDAPDDDRIVDPLYLTPANTPAQSAAIYVVTHVNVIPPGQGRSHDGAQGHEPRYRQGIGNIAYQVLVQAGRSNHFTVLEAWSSKAALDAHAVAAHTRSFRQKLSPLAGALYDERLFTKLE